MRVKPIAFGVLVITLFLGVVGTSMAAGLWQSTGRTAAGAAADSGADTSTAERPGGMDASGAAADGSGATSDVKGWMALGDVAAAAGVEPAEILAAFELPADTPASTPLKDLESDLFSVQALRAWLAERDVASASPGASGSPTTDGPTPSPSPTD